MRMTTFGSGLFGLAICLAAGTASAEEMKFMAELTGAQEVPPVETTASGMMDVTYDTESKMLSWTGEYSGLSGDATASHYHGPAPAGENAGPVLPVEIADIEEGSAELTEEQATALQDGMWYFNIHTEANPAGEIRGQVVAAQ